MSQILLPQLFLSQPQYPAPLKDPGFWRLVDIQGLPPLGTASASITRTLNGTARLNTGRAGKCTDFVATGDWLSYGANPDLHLSTMTGIAVVEVPSSPSDYATIFNTNVSTVAFAGGFVVRVNTDGTVTAFKQDIAVFGTTAQAVQLGKVSTIAWSYNNISGLLRIAIDGQLESFTQAATLSHDVVGRNQYYRNDTLQAKAHKQYLFALSAECDKVADAQLREWSLNPWRLFKASGRRIFASSGGATNYTLTADSFSLTLTGTDAGLEYNRVLSADPVSLSFDVADATLKRGYTLSADPVSIAFSGADASLKHDRVLQADSAAIELTGSAASLEYNRVIQADSATMQFNVADATLTYTQPGNYTLTAESVALGVAVSDASLQYHRKLAAETEWLAFNGADASLRYARAVIAEASQIAFAVSDATLTRTGGPEPISSIVERTAVFQRSKSVIVRFN